MDEDFIKDVDEDGLHRSEADSDQKDTFQSYSRNSTNISSIMQSAEEARKIRMIITFGWIFAALAAFINPYFAIIGITLGLLANRKVKGMGNYIIATNLILGTVNLIFGFFGIIIGRFFLGGS